MNNDQKMNRLFLVMAVLSALLMVSSCSTMKKSDAKNMINANARTDDYILGQDDVIHLIIERHPEWSGEYTIKPDGKILIPSIGDVKLSGLSKTGAEVACAAILDKYINNPEVAIDITRYASEMIYVLGEVNQPGRYSTGGKKITLRDAVILAGLPAHFAATSRVYVITTSENRPVQHVVNLYRVLYRGETKYNIIVKPGDVVYIPKTIWGEIVSFITDLLSPASSVTTARQAVAPVP